MYPERCHKVSSYKTIHSIYYNFAIHEKKNEMSKSIHGKGKAKKLQMASDKGVNDNL